MSAVLDPIDQLKAHSGRWEWGPQVRDATRQSIPALLWALHDMGGVCDDAKIGHAAAKLMDHATALGYPVHPTHLRGGSNLSSLLAAMEHGKYHGCIKRDTYGKRTYKITLLLDEARMPPKPTPVTVKPVEDSPPEVVGNGGPSPGHEEPPTPPPAAPEPAPAPQPDVVDVVEVAEIEPELPPLVAVSGDPLAILLQIQQLSMQAFVAFHAEAGDTAPGDKPTIDPERYAATLEENNRLRAKVNDATARLNAANETIRAKTKEINGLRQAILIAQNNLKTMQDNVDLAPKRERDLARLNGNQKFIAAPPEPAIAGRRAR